MRETFLFLSVLFLAGIHCGADQNIPQMRPVDHSGRDSSFPAFKNLLLSAVEHKDSTAILQSLSDNVQVGFDADGIGKEAFRREWEPYDPESRLWYVLPCLLDAGCVRETTDTEVRFVCPYSHATFPDSLDPDLHGFLSQPDVPLYQEPSKTADTVVTLDYAILRIVSYTSEGWVEVKLPNRETTAFLPQSKLGPPGGDRAYFKSTDQGWKIAVLLSGN